MFPEKQLELPALLEELEAAAVRMRSLSFHVGGGCFRVCAERIKGILREVLTLPAPPMFVPTTPPPEVA